MQYERELGHAELLFMLRQGLGGQRFHQRVEGDVRSRESKGGSDRVAAENRRSRKTLPDRLTLTPKREEGNSKQLAVIERARRTPARTVEIERTRRGTAYRNMLKRYGAKAVLERELERLAEEWSKYHGRAYRLCRLAGPDAGRRMVSHLLGMGVYLARPADAGPRD
jgi:hypothetical protein